VGFFATSYVYKHSAPPERTRLQGDLASHYAIGFVIFSLVLGGEEILMSTTIVVDLKEETMAALDDAAREEGVSQSELIDRALQDYLFIRRFRSLRERMVAKDGNTFTDQEIFDLIS
jgi:hypothetical protein